MNKPLVTVFCSAYNHEKFVRQMVASIVHQTYGYDNIELIIIDDCSTDSTGIILKKIQKEFNFTFIQNTQNLGVVKNLNRIIKMAHGKYLAGIASDDYWSVTKIEKQVKLLENINQSFAVCHTNANIINENGKFLYIHNRGKNFNGKIMPKILIENGIVAPSVMFRKDVFRSIGFFDENIEFEDRDMWIRIANKYKFAFINEPLIFRRKHSNNLSRNKVVFYKVSMALFEKHKKYNYKYNYVKEYHYALFSAMSNYSTTKAIYHMIKSGKLLFTKHNTFANLIKCILPKKILKSSFISKIKNVLKKW
jgi:glycosyltransferase involved in cell wall biosynthesis